MKLIPTLDRVVILPEEKMKVSKGGIHLPDQAQKEVTICAVRAVRPGGFNQDGSRRPMSVKVGDKVFYTDVHTTETGGKLVIVDDEDILAIVKG